MAIDHLKEEQSFKKVQSFFGPEIPESDILRALSKSHYDPDAAMKFILNNAKPITTMRTVTSTGARISTQIKQEVSNEQEESHLLHRSKSISPKSRMELRMAEFDEFVRATSAKIRVKEENGIDIENDNEHLNKIGVLKSEVGPEDECLNAQVKQQESVVLVSVKAEPVNEYKPTVAVKEEHASGVEQKVSVNEETVSNQPRPFDDCKAMLEDGDFPEEPGWFLVGRTVVTAISTSKGGKLVDNEIVYFSFPTSIGKFNSIVRFATKRFGEIGRLPMEWTKCVVPLVNSGKVELNARCVAAPPVLFMMQDIMLYVSFYIHHSIFTDVDMYSWKLNASNIDFTVYPLLTLFRLLKIRPYQNAEFTPEELDSRKRLLNLEVCGATLLFILHFFDIIICIV
ncbi:hypothetical protein FEM48_Zijuj09G0190200 [Ziziphus jujuba var. spinosa]|uniref:HIRAN domain-containing protein n=1 Tax=Ziziphus jujuba var. spinosa TaxID=714518 RepID=A0A978UUR7_ZIZJJ|nr:hypothetical protein FEM48_Zijuj09G0190200 [Ziziphus jujuba var. spinosa]